MRLRRVQKPMLKCVSILTVWIPSAKHYSQLTNANPPCCSFPGRRYSSERAPFHPAGICIAAIKHIFKSKRIGFKSSQDLEAAKKRISRNLNAPSVEGTFFVTEAANFCGAVPCLRGLAWCHCQSPCPLLPPPLHLVVSPCRS